MAASGVELVDGDFYWQQFQQHNKHLNFGGEGNADDDEVTGVIGANAGSIDDTQQQHQQQQPPQANTNNVAVVFVPGF